MSGKNQLPAKGENGYEVYRREAASFNKVAQGNGGIVARFQSGQFRSRHR
jgi:hypothetical protein